MMKRLYLPLLFLAGLFFLAGAGYAILSAPGTYALRIPEASPPEGAQIGVRAATDELLSGFGDYLDLRALEEGELRLVFASNMRLMNFRVITVGYDNGFYESGEVIVRKELLPNRPIVVSWPEQGDMPHRGISFVDENHETRHFTLEINREEAMGEPFSLREF